MWRSAHCTLGEKKKKKKCCCPTTLYSDVLFCCCCQSTSIFAMLFQLRCSAGHHSYQEWLSQPLCQIQPTWLFPTDLSHHHSTSVHKAAAQWMWMDAFFLSLLFLAQFWVISREGCISYIFVYIYVYLWICMCVFLYMYIQYIHIHL